MPDLTAEVYTYDRALHIAALYTDAQFDWGKPPCWIGASGAPALLMAPNILRVRTWALAPAVDRGSKFGRDQTGLDVRCNAFSRTI
jgi:hypothetical protein